MRFPGLRVLECCNFQFSTEAEVLDRANAVDYGLCASVWSENVGTIHRMAKGLQVRVACLVYL